MKATIDVGEGSIGIAAGEGGVWVANSDANTVSRIDPATDTVVATIDVGAQPVDVTVGAGAVWVTEFGDDTVARIDPATNDVTAHIPVRPGACGDHVRGRLCVGGQRDGRDRLSDRPGHQRGDRDDQVGADPHGVTFGEGSVWVAVNDEDAVVRIDP